MKRLKYIFEACKPDPRLVYAPRDDITVWELAQVTKLLANPNWFTWMKYWERLPKEVKRHFYVLEE